MQNIKKGIWLHNLPGTEEEVRAVVKRLSAHGFHLVIPCVKNPDGYLDYHSQVGRIRPSFQAFDPLRVMVEEAAAHAMEVHPWLCVFPEGEGSALLADHPEYAAVMRPGPKTIKGDYGIHWACSSREEVHRYELSLYRELLARYPVTGVHLDYIRNCTRFAGVESCFCPHCREKFHEESGYGGEIADLERGHPYWWQWVRWRTGRIDSFVKELRGLADSFKKEISAAVFTDYPVCIEEVGQDWGSWGRENLVDLLIPMTYTQSPQVMAGQTAAHKIHAAGTRLWEGIRTFKDMQPENLRTNLETLRRQGVEGVVLFEYNLFTDEFLGIVDDVLR